MEKEDLTETYWENTSPQAKSIDIGQRNFNFLPKHINKFVALEEFYAWENRISSLPIEMGSLKSLRIIVLNANQFTSFPEILCQLPLLTDIHIARNKLSSLHQDLTTLKHLRVLSLEYNLFKSVPEEIYSIESLEELALTGNELGEISESLGNLTNLKKLELAEAKLRVLPNSISQLTRLNVLNVEYNNLLDFPTGIQACTSLKYIRAHGNDFETYPDSLLSVPNLVHTSVGGSKGLVYDRTAFFQNPTAFGRLGDSILEKSDDADEIMKGLFLGSFVSAKNKHYLVQKKVTDILTIMEDDHASVYPHLFNYHLIRLDDVPSSDLYAHFSSAYDIISKAKGGTLVHCQMGVSRSATIVISYVMKKKKISLWEAFHEVVSVRGIIHPNAGFIQQLKKYETFLGIKSPYPEINTIEQFHAFKRKAKTSGNDKDGNCIVS